MSNKYLNDGNIAREEETVAGTESTAADSSMDKEYYDLPVSPKSRNRIWSVVSLAMGILSVLLCPFYYVSLAFAAVAVVGSVVSRQMLGYFDRMAIVGLLLGLVGVVFGAFSLVASLTGVLDGLLV